MNVLVSMLDIGLHGRGHKHWSDSLQEVEISQPSTRAL